MTVEAGRVLGGRYRVEGSLRTGDRVLLTALDDWSGQRVLLAGVPLPGDPERAATVRRTVGREVHLVAGLRHPHLSRVLGAVTDDPATGGAAAGGAAMWVASESRSSVRTLHDVLGDAGHADPGRVARWGRDLADGLATLHGIGLIHRAVRPGLVLIHDDGSAALTGVAATADLSGTDLTGTEGPGRRPAGTAEEEVRALAGMLRDALPPDALPPDAPSPASGDADGTGTSGGRDRVVALTTLLDRVRSGSTPTTAARLRDDLAATMVAQPTAAGLPPAAPDATEHLARPVPADAAGSGTAPPASDATEYLARPAPSEPAPSRPPGRHDPTEPAQRRVPPPPTVAPPRPPGPPTPTAGAARPGSGTRPPPPPTFVGRPAPPGDRLPYPDGTGPAPATTEIDRPRRRGRSAGHRAALIVLVVLVVGGVAAALWFLRPAATGRDGSGSATPAAGSIPASFVGDPRTADACSLLPEAALRRFGPTVVHADYPDLVSCSAVVSTGGTGTVLVTAAFSATGEFTPGPPTTRVGEVAITRYTPAGRGQRCSRLLSFPDGNAARIDAEPLNGASATDLCAVADAVTATAVPVLTGGNVARRIPDPADPLEQVDACSLVDPAAAGRIAGLNADRVLPGFGLRGCYVGYDPALADAPYAHVVIARLFPLQGGPVRIGRHSAVVTATPGSATRSASCSVYLVQRSYTDRAGNARAAVVAIDRFGPGAGTDTRRFCADATALATAAESKLPPPS